MAISERELRPRITNNTITNLQQVVDAIRKCEDYDLLKEFEDEVLKYTVGKDIVGTEELKSALTLKIQEITQVKTSNKNVLEVLKKQNPNLKNLSVIETMKNQNDCGKAVDYIKYTDEFGIIQLLECRDANTLNDFVEEHLDLAVTGDAKEIYEFFCQYKHANLRFAEIHNNTINDIKQELIKMKIINPKINNENDFQEEKQLIEEFASQKAKNIIPKVAINSYGERIYTVGDIVVKFKEESAT